MSSVCHSYVFVCHSYVLMSSVCHSYVPVCHRYVTRMYSYVIRIYSYVIRMSLVCHPYVTRMYLYVHCCINNSPQFLEDKIQTRLFSVSTFLVQSLMKKLRNSRNIYGIEVKLGPLSKLDKRNTLTSKKLTMTFSSFFQFQTNLEQSRDGI